MHNVGVLDLLAVFCLYWLEYPFGSLLKCLVELAAISLFLNWDTNTSKHAGGKITTSLICYVMVSIFGG